MIEHDPPLIVTLQLDAASFKSLNALRQAHFPPQRNFLPAHITLFHALPGMHLTQVREQLDELSQRTPPMKLWLSGVRMLGRGVALEVSCERLLAVRAQLAERFSDWLTPQDRQRYRPHITIQNKVEPHTARNLYQQLAEQWEPWVATGEGLLLWHYLGGPWGNIAAFPFAAYLCVDEQEAISAKGAPASQAIESTINNRSIDDSGALDE